MANKQTLEAMGVVTGPDAFFSKMFEVRDALHLTHLYQADYSLSTHLALEEAYSAILPILDGMIEGYTGLYYPPNLQLKSTVRIKDPIAFAKNTYTLVNSSVTLFSDSWIRNEMDELAKIFAMLLYKLQYVR